ncbi:substrate-binding domain-containing protein [Pseudonocardia sp. MH-G8]|uniref:sugar ABC transporter substrate-binding protein n=1 Tax=Pseudonocardia sp. MH-G8 TaxID=1854588 RepID=UPI001179AA24|nr:substrate-binding domain-containing protein [Pseudonocardia sp. MH-G8]
MRSTVRAVVLAAAVALAAAGCSTSDAERADGTGGPSLGVVQGDSGNSVGHRSAADVNLPGTRIALIAFANNPFWDTVIQGAEAANHELSAHGASVDYITAGSAMDVPTVENALNSAVSQGYDAIGVVSLADGACPAISRAAAAVPVATFIAEGNCAQQAGAAFFRGQPAIDAGAKAATAMAQATLCTGSIGIITGSFSVQQHEQRRQGFVDAYAQECPGSPIVGTVENGDDAGQALSQANDLMTANPDLRGIYVTAGGPFGAGQAVQQRGRTGKVAVVAYDFVPQNVDLIRSGVMQAAVGQDPYGSSYDTAIDLFNMLAGQPKPEKYFQPVDVAVMTTENVDEVLRSQGTE